MPDNSKLKTAFDALGERTRRIADKFQHTAQSLMYMRDEIDALSRALEVYARTLNEYLEEVEKEGEAREAKE